MHNEHLSLDSVGSFLVPRAGQPTVNAPSFRFQKRDIQILSLPFFPCIFFFSVFVTQILRQWCCVIVVRTGRPRDLSSSDARQQLRNLPLFTIFFLLASSHVLRALCTRKEIRLRRFSKCAAFALKGFSCVWLSWSVGR